MVERGGSAPVRVEESGPTSRPNRTEWASMVKDAEQCQLSPWLRD